MMSLSGPARPPASGQKARQLVILLHGLGADGNDLIGLAPPLARHLPDATFISPNAAFPCDMAPYGYQWFSAQDRRPEAVLAGVRAAAPILDGFITDEMARHGLDESKTALLGFSQGAMMSLFVGLRRERPVAAIAALSGRLIGVDMLAAELRSRPRTLLVHGTDDEVVPYSSLAEAESALKAAGVPVEAVSCVGLGHGIDETGLDRCARLLREAFRE